MHPTRTGIIVASLALLLAFGSQAALAQPAESSPPDPAEWAPAEALVYVGIQDIQEYCTDMRKTSSYQAMQDEELGKSPVMAGLFEFGGILKEVKKRLAKLLDVAPDELKNPFAGPLTFYVTTPPGGRLSDVQMALVAGVGDPAVLQRYLDALTPRLKEAATRYETTSAGRYTLHVFTTTKSKTQTPKEDEEFEFEAETGPFGDMPNPAEVVDKLFAFEDLPPELAYCLADKRLLVANSAEHLKAVLSGGRGKTLAETDDHKLLLKHFRPIGQGRFLINMPRLFEAARAEGTDDESLRQVMSVLGAGSMRSVVGHWRVGTKSYNHKSELLVLSSGQRSGLLKILSMENRPIEPPAWVSADTALYFSLNVNPPTLLDDALAIMSQNDPEMGRELSNSLQNGPPGPDGQPMNWRKALIDHLSGPLTAGVSISRPYGADSLKYLVSLGHRSRDALTQLLGILTGGSTPREFRGTPIFTESNTGQSVAVTSDRAMLGNPPAVEAALAPTQGAGLAQDATFKRAQRHVPEEAWCILYVDSRKMMEGLIGLAEKQDELMANPFAMGVMFMLRASGLDLSDTASNQKLLKYASPVIVAIATVPDGVRLTYVDLRQTEE
mgnify:CR=1 FL=1